MMAEEILWLYMFTHISCVTHSQGMNACMGIIFTMMKLTTAENMLACACYYMHCLSSVDRRVVNGTAWEML